MPLAGTRFKTTLMLKNAWITILVVNPTASSIPSLSGARNPARNPRHKKNPKTSAKVIAPVNPSSSAITEKIKSDCGSGRNNNFCLPCPNPRPFTPPEPTAISDCRI